MHRHLSSATTAVIQAEILVNVIWGIPPIRYCNSIGSNGKSASLKAGVKQIFVQTSDARHPISAMANAENNRRHMIVII